MQALLQRQLHNNNLRPNQKMQLRDKDLLIPINSNNETTSDVHIHLRIKVDDVIVTKPSKFDGFVEIDEVETLMNIYAAIPDAIKERSERNQGDVSSPDSVYIQSLVHEVMTCISDFCFMQSISLEK